MLCVIRGWFGGACVVVLFHGAFLVLSVSGEGKGRNEFAERHNYARNAIYAE